MQFLVVIVVMFALMYLLVMRPQRAKQAAHQKMLDRIGPGTGILTAGGIYGTVEEIDDDGDLWVEIAEGVTVHVARRSVGAVVDFVEEEDEAEEQPIAEKEPAPAEEEPAVEEPR